MDWTGTTGTTPDPGQDHSRVTLPSSYDTPTRQALLYGRPAQRRPIRVRLWPGLVIVLLTAAAVMVTLVLAS